MYIIRNVNLLRIQIRKPREKFIKKNILLDIVRHSLEMFKCYIVSFAIKEW